MKFESGNAFCSLDIAQQEAVCALARRVGEEVCRQRDLLPARLTEEHGVEWKMDEAGYESPVTPLDKWASLAVIKDLCRITPDIPIISEESSPEDQQAILAAAWAKARHDNKKGPTYWSVDPIDGTSAFVDGREYYAVLVGLIEERRPTFGVAYFPKLDTMFFTRNGRAWETTRGVTSEIRIEAPPNLEDGLDTGNEITLRMQKGAIAALAARNGMAQNPKLTIARQDVSDEAMPYGDIQLLRGKLDLHFAKIRYLEWDLAAYQAIMEAAGARYVSADDGRTIRYGADKNLRTPAHWLGHPALLQRLGLHL